LRVNVKQLLRDAASSQLRNRDVSQSKMTAPPPPFKRDSSWFKSGMTAPVSGIYRVYHYRHRIPHAVFVPSGAVFPTCKGCGDKVQFAPLIAGEPIEKDADLAKADGTAA
jgi:hypothetical protein